jgi:tetratricopeptide (TPR) repeat protein
MQRKIIQITGLVWTLAYASIIVWIYATEPRSFKEVATNSQVAVGTYEINQERFSNGLALFRRDQFRAARDEWAAADPAQKDARTQFYIAYAWYRWGRVYYDNAFFKQGLEAVNRAINLAPNGTLTVDDPDLQMHTAAELKTELEEGTETSWKDLNPLKLFRQRK